MAKHVLIGGDESQISDELGAYLRADGFETIVKTNVADTVAALQDVTPDLLLLDITLPDGSGLDILRTVRERNIPTIVLTAHANQVERLVGFELGADDYITKPYSPREVSARIRAVLRRTGARNARGSSQNDDVRRIGALEINFVEHKVRTGRKAANLTPSELKLLEVLAMNLGHALTRAELLDKLGEGGSIFERTLDRHINNLRRKIEPNVQEPTYIRTVYGVGYRMQVAHDNRSDL